MHPKNRHHECDKNQRGRKSNEAVYLFYVRKKAWTFLRIKFSQK